MAPLKAERRYDVYNNYQVPRIRGTFLLHQLRLLVGNETFSRIMNTVHTRFKDAPMKTSQFVAAAEEISGATLKPFIMQWLERDALPAPVVAARVVQNGDSWSVDLRVTQKGIPFHFMTTVAVETAKERRWQVVEVKEAEQSLTIPASGKPVRLVFNVGNDIPVNRSDYYILSNYFDDYHHSMIIYGTTQQIEANHTLALRYQTVLADAFTDILAPVRKESELEPADLGSSDLIILGGPSDNALTRPVADSLGISFGKNMFRWRGKTYADPDDGLVVVYPNPYNPAKVCYLIAGNSALELYQMTKRYQSLPSWGIYRGDQVVDKGFHEVDRFRFDW